MIFRLVFLSFAAVVFSAEAARASEGFGTEYVRTEIVSETDGFAPGETVWFAVRQQVRPGWHVFWSNPGDAGLPLELTWKLPEGFTAGEIAHPAPEFIPIGPLASYAHTGAPVFLVSVTAPADLLPGDRIAVEVDAFWQVCEEICVPEEAAFAFSMPVVEQASPRNEVHSLFAQARAALPEAYQGDVRLSRMGDRYFLSVDDWKEKAVGKAFFFPALEGFTVPAAPQKVKISNGALQLQLKPGWTAGPDGGVLEGVLTAETASGERKAYALAAAIDGSLAPPEIARGPANVGLLLILAFAGGLILNAMPCVFPIIFVKAATFMQSAHEDRRVMRAHGAFYMLGVLASFALMGGVLLALRAGGEQLGWGFHLQSPPVVALSAYALLLVGLNLAGLFTVGENLTGAGDSLTKAGGAGGAFFTGVLAVVVAAPCIGPLLSAPMGAALVQPAAVGMAIFLAMGLGLAAPYVALAFAPALGRMLPKPGPWMAVFKQALAFPVFAAAAYFLWVFIRQTDGAAVAAILAGAVLLSFSAWAFEKSKGDGRRALVLRIVAAIAAVLALAPLTRIEARAETPAAGAYGSIPSEPYDAMALAAYRAAGTPVFVDFTADWCVTCQINKMTVLKRRDVADAFRKTGSVLMVGDWTVRDPAITEALRSFGASGVPLYVYYPANGPAEVLPQTLSRNVVLKALESGAAGRQ